MCGIAGIFAYSDTAPNVDLSSLNRIHHHLARRGPDGEGMWMAPGGRIALAHRRLAIIDLSPLAAQPMANPEQQQVISFNGEIYNYKHLRRALESKGYVFRSHSDTEVLLHLYRDRGPAMLQELRGMFAFAIWDESQKGLFLARDPYGIKPLYYSDDGKTLRFASQVKALLAGGGINTTADEAGWAGFYLFGSVPEPYTIYQGIKAVQAGSSLWIDTQGRHQENRYFSLAKTWSDACKSPSQPISDPLQTIRRALLESVDQHRVSDVPVGCFLSAGIDSSVLLGLMSEFPGSPIQTVTVKFKEFNASAEDEAPQAEYTAQYYGASHHTRCVNKSEFLQDLPAILEAMDQPSIDGINTWFASKAAAELGLKVTISGIGADELFAGYPAFRNIPRWVRYFALPNAIPGIGGGIRRILQHISALHPKAPGMFEYAGTYAGAYLLQRGLFMPWELPLGTDPELLIGGLRTLQPVKHINACLGSTNSSPYARVAILEANLYLKNQLLRDADWAGMAHGLEIRTPLVDAQLLAQLAPVVPQLPMKKAKHCLAAAPAKPLPAAVISRTKTGFQTPIGQWIKDGAASNIPNPLKFRGNKSRWHWSRHWALCVGAAFR